MSILNIPVVADPVILLSPFGIRNGTNHHGADFAPIPRNSNPGILAFDDGEIIVLQRGNPTAGNWIDLLHSGNRATTYMHLDSISPGLTAGSRVRKGQQIGIMGTSGRSTTIHLHFEYREVFIRNLGRNAIDPLPILLNQRGVPSMNIIQRPSPNHSAGRQGRTPSIIVCHITDGNFPGSIDWAVNPDTGISYHYMVSRTGEITQCVNIANTAWANGSTLNAGDRRDNQHSRVPAVRGGGVNANFISVSIGHEGVHDITRGELSAAQLAATVSLIRYIREEARRIWGIDIPITRDNIVGHADVVPLWRSDCPGARFPFDEIIRQLGGTASPASGQVPATQSPSSDGLIRVWLGPFPNRKKADAARDELRASGIRDVAKAWTVESGNTWRVQATATSSRSGAEALAEQLRNLRNQSFGPITVS